MARFYMELTGDIKPDDMSRFAAAIAAAMNHDREKVPLLQFDSAGITFEFEEE